MKAIRTVLTAAALLSLAGAVSAQETPPATVAAPPPAPAAVVAPAAPTPSASEWRPVVPENLLVIDTTKGRVLVELAPLAAPQHVERVRLLARRGFYDNLAWHRVIDWFMAQTGDPLGTGEGQSPFPDLPGEFTFRRGPDDGFVPAASPTGAVLGFVGSLPVETQPDALMARTADGKVHAWGVYCPGVAGMARDEGLDTANSQFFLMRQAYPSLDKRYTVWGRVVSGLEVVRALTASETPDGIVAGTTDRMVQVRVASDIPEADRPVVSVLAPGSARFQGLVAETRRTRGADFSICDVELPSQVAVGAPPAA